MELLRMVFLLHGRFTIPLSSRQWRGGHHVAFEVSTMPSFAMHTRHAVVVYSLGVLRALCIKPPSRPGSQVVSTRAVVKCFVSGTLPISVGIESHV